MLTMNSRNHNEVSRVDGSSMTTVTKKYSKKRKSVGGNEEIVTHYNRSAKKAKTIDAKKTS